MWDETVLLRLKKFTDMSDFEFYETYLEDATLEELADFCKEFPEFLEDEIKTADKKYASLDSGKMLEKIKQKIEENT